MAEFLIQDIFEINGWGLVLTGSLISGVISVGMNAVVNGKEVEIIGLEMFRKRLEEISAEQEESKSLGLLVKGGKKEDFEIIIKLKQEIVFN